MCEGGSIQVENRRTISITIICLNDLDLHNTGQKELIKTKDLWTSANSDYSIL